MYPIILVLLASVCRLLPHAPNFTPIGAMALFAGSEIKDIRVAILVTLGAMFLSDIVIGTDVTSIAVYIALAFSVLIGRALKSSSGVGAGVLSSLLSATVFFVITNLAVWAWSGIYPLTVQGLTECFVLALPFFRPTIVSDLLYLCALSSFSLIARSASSRPSVVLAD